jgi:hypothetical protein
VTANTSMKQKIKSTMFYTQGNPIALLTNSGAKKRRHLTFATAAAALAWCVINRSNFVYFPCASDASHN